MKLGDPKVVGELMRKRRHDLGFTIEQMAEAVGISPITIMRLELGRVGYIHAKTAKALEVPKRIEKRMVMVNTAIAQDNSEVVLPPLSMLTKGPSVASSGDVEALPSKETHKALESKPRRLYKRPTLVKQTNVEASSPLKKALMWLAAKV